MWYTRTIAVAAALLLAAPPAAAQNGRFALEVRGGALYNHVELESNDGDLIQDSGHEFGWEAGGGVSIALGSNLALAPGVRYRTFPAKPDLGNGPVTGDLPYLSFDIGLLWAFGKAGFAAAR
jgi:opacity protein-like surface antigen